jgi:hypothetical protein
MSEKTIQINLIKEAFALGIKQQQDKIIRLTNEMRFGLDRVNMHSVEPVCEEKLAEEIDSAEKYIEFYKMMYLGAEDIRQNIRSYTVKSGVIKVEEVA